MKTVRQFDISIAYDQMHRHFNPRRRTPIIGLTGNYHDNECGLAEVYYTSVLKAGGTPLTTQIGRASCRERV